MSIPPLKVLHIADGMQDTGYEEVLLIANRVSKTNHLRLIQRADGQKYCTGGFLMKDCPEIRALLKTIPKEEQFRFMRMLRAEPFAKPYAEEKDLA